MNKIIQSLKHINWDFSDYNSSKYPLDINSIPWYPATFPTPIPKYLISLLSSDHELVLDPFGGKGTTAIEAIKQNRYTIYNDINPFANDIVKSLIASIKHISLNDSIIDNIIIHDKIKLNHLHRIDNNIIYNSENAQDSIRYSRLISCLEEYPEINISQETILWYHIDTLLELIEIKKLIIESNEDEYLIRKVALISILKETSSQRGHFTYVTDNCKPKTLKYYNAIDSYLNMLNRLNLAVKDYLRQFFTINKTENLLEVINNTIIHQGDARKLSWISSNSIDLVITSPPYLCAQDYTKTMRLVNFFFPNDNFLEIAKNEIGPRSQRRGKSEIVVSTFYNDMKSVFSDVYRVLKKDKYFCLIIGQGKGKVTQPYDTILDLKNILTNELNFSLIYSTQRNISHKAIRIGGVENEDIIILKK